MTQSSGKWLIRSAIFTIAFILIVSVVGIIGIQQQFILSGLEAPSFGTIMRMLSGQLTLIALPIILIRIAILFAIGMFVFMPRKPLDRESFFAVYWTFWIWSMTMMAVVMLTPESAYDRYSAALILLPLFIMLAATIGMFVSIISFSRKIGIPKSVLLLSFPFGLSIYSYTGYFLPFKSNEQTVMLKYNWYRRFVEFMLYNNKGQIILAAVMVACVAAIPWPSELFMISFFAVLYFWKGKNWLAGNIKRLSWISAIVNLSMFAYIIFFFKAFTQAGILM